MAQQQSMINARDAFFLSTIGNDTLHSTIKTQEIDANLARFSTVFVSDTLNASTVKAQIGDISDAFISSLRVNRSVFSTLSLRTDVSGGIGRVTFTADASGVVVSGDPLIFNNIVFLTSSINVVQVSTIVDATIEAQSGFFSTLSSGVVTAGSITASSIRANAGFFSTLNVSSITTTDISGFAPSDWSLYPTLNSSITFQPGNVLSNVGSKLFFAGTEITDLSGGGQNWSRFPALQDVSMNNFSLRALSTLQYQDGATLVSQTGNNLFYNGQPITSGVAGNASNWSQFPAKTNIIAGQSTLTVGNIQNNGSNITNGNTFTNSLGVGGLSLVPIASITSGGDLSCRNIEVGDSVTGLADVNIYGATALPGDNALYVEGGVQFQGGLIHGFSAGVIPVAGINSGRIDVLQAGINILHPVAVVATSAGAMSLATGGAMSLAAGAFIETNTSTLKMTNSSQGNKNTTVQTGFLTIDPSVAATSSIKLFNTSGGGVEIDGGGQGTLQGFSTLNSQFISSISTNAGSVRGLIGGFSTVGYNYALGVSTDTLSLRVRNINLVQDLTGISAGGPTTARILALSTINSFNVSTTDLWCSSINGQAIGSGGGGASTISSFVTLETSSFKVSTMSGTVGTSFAGSTIFVEGGFQFVGEPTSGPGGSRFLSSCRGILSPGERLAIEAEEIDIIFEAGGTEYVRIGGGGAFDTKIRSYGGGGAVSTSFLLAETIVANPATGVDISGNVFVNGTVTLPEAGGGVNFDFGSPGNFSRLMRNDVATNNMLTLVNTTGGVIGETPNMVALGVGELWIGGGTDDFGAIRIYSQFPFGNLGIDAIDADGTNLGEAYNLYQVPGDIYQANLAFVSSINGFADPFGVTVTSVNNLLRATTMAAPVVSTLNLQVSTINGFLPSAGGGGSTISTFAVLEGAQFFTSSIQGVAISSFLNTNLFSTLGASSITFSTATSIGSNTAFNYPIFIDYDQAGGGTAASGVGIAIQGHNFASGAAISRIEMGSRGNGDSYIMSLWPGQNLEDLYIDATDTIFNNGTLSTIINKGSGIALTSLGAVIVPTVSTQTLTTSSIVANVGVFQTLSTQALLVSSIGGNDARPAYTNNIQTSTMLLAPSAFELAYWDSRNPASNITVSGYDTTVNVSGVYKMGCRIQGFNGGLIPEELIMNFLQNGSTIIGAETTQEIQMNSEDSIYMETLIQCASGDNLQVQYFTSDSNVQVFATAGSPAAILTLYKID